MDRSPTGRLLPHPESLIDRWLRRNNPARVADAYQQIRDMDFSKLESRVLAMPRALGAPFGAIAQRQWAKRERIHARLRITRKRH